MKIQHFLLGATLLSTLILTGCGNKDLSFDEAKEVALKNSNLISQLLLGSESPIQQNFSLETVINDGAGTNVDLSLSSQSQQDRTTGKTKTDIAFDTTILTEGTSIGASGTLTALLLPETLFVNVEKLGIKSSDLNVGMVAGMLQGVQGQWFKLPLSWGTEMFDGVHTYLSTLANLEEKNADLLIEQGNQAYQGTFPQFANTPAYQFTLDQDKTQIMLQDLLTAVNQLNQQTSTLTTTEEEIPLLTGIDVQIPLFEGNLVILGKNDVAIVVDNFEIISNGVSLVGAYRYSSDGMVLNLREKESWQDLITINVIKTQKNTYSVDIQFGTTIIIKGTASTTIKKSELKLGFDLTMNINLENPTLDEEGEAFDSTPITMTIPLKWERSYSNIKSVDFTEPTEAIDITEMLGGLLGAGALGEDAYRENEYDELYGYTDEYAMGDENVEETNAEETVN